MKKSLLVVPVLAIVAGCMETEGEFATGSNTSGGSASASISPRSDGTYSLVLSTEGSTCTAVYDEATPGGTELSALNCAGGGSGNATVSYDNAGVPARVTFGGVGISSGTIKF